MKVPGLHQKESVEDHLQALFADNPSTLYQQLPIASPVRINNFSSIIIHTGTISLNNVIKIERVE